MSASSCPTVQQNVLLPTVQQSWRQSPTQSHQCSPSKGDLDHQQNSICNCVDCSPPTYHLDSDEFLEPFDEQQWLNEVTLSKDSQGRLSQRHRETIRRRMRSAQKRNVARRKDVRQLFDVNSRNDIKSKSINLPESKQTSFNISSSSSEVKRSNSAREFDRHGSSGRHRSLPSILWNSLDSSSVSSSQTDGFSSGISKGSYTVTPTHAGHQQQRRRSRFFQLIEHISGKSNTQYRFDETVQQPLLSLPPLANGRRHSWWHLQSARRQSGGDSSAVEILSMKQRSLTDTVQHFVADNPVRLTLDINHNLLHPNDSIKQNTDNQSEANSITNEFIDQSPRDSLEQIHDQSQNISSSDLSTLDFYAPYIVLPSLDDCGFNEVRLADDRNKFLELNYLDHLNETQQAELNSLLLLELTTLLDEHGIAAEKTLRIDKKVKRKLQTSVSAKEPLFGRSLEELVERDGRKFHWPERVPFMLKQVIEYIRTNGLNEEGILRIGASIQRAQGLCDELSKLYASSLTRECSRTLESMMSQLLAEYSICDSIAVFKQFIRRLPEPLLSFRLMDAFLVVAKIPSLDQQLQTLNLLLLLLPSVNRQTLRQILSLLGDIRRKSDCNRMNLKNVATVIAPNLFPNVLVSTDRSRSDSSALNSAHQLARAMDSCKVTQLLIHYQDLLFRMPPYIICQVSWKNQI